MASWPTGIETIRSLIAANSVQKVAISAQFAKPPRRDAFRSFGRLRRSRNQIEYDDISPITADDITADGPAVRLLHATASQLVEVLSVFVH